jgi:DNA-binding beta-propeller fold protein YncE
MIKTYGSRLILLPFFTTLLLVSTLSYALPFNITPRTALPKNVVPGQTELAFYTVTNNTSTTRTGNYVKYLPPNVAQVTSDSIYPDLCGSTFTLNSKGSVGSSCILELKISGAVNAADPNPHSHLFVCFPGGVSCAGTPNPLNVTAIRPVAKRLAYVSNFGTNNVQLCSINPDTGSLLNCRDSGVGAVFDNPAVVAINPIGSRAYVSNFGGSVGTVVSLCSVNLITGDLSSCANSDGDGTAVFNGPLGITLDSSLTRAYIPSINANTVDVCTIAANTGKLIDCVNTGGAFVNPISATFNALRSQVYISNTGNGTISLCAVDFNTGNLTNCINSDGDGSAVFSGPALISFSGTGRVYVSNNGMGAGTSVSLCYVDEINGKLFACGDSGVGPIFNAPVSVSLNSDNTLLYVTNNASTTVSKCVVNTTTGKLTSCANADGDGTAVFSSPAGIVLR